MKTLKALSLTSNVHAWLRTSQDPRILHLFAHACNLINERKEVLSIVAPQIGDGPFNLVMKKEICFLDYINLESLVLISPTQLTLGNLPIHIADATTWNPRPDWEILHTKADEILDQIKQLRITNYLKNGDLPIIQSLASHLCLALVTADIPSVQKNTSKLAGLGPGLTPSGDDFLMGAMYAVWILQPSEVANILAQEIVNTAAPLTTSLSAAWLRSAARGEAGILWHEFFDALVSGDPARVQATMKNILAVGETSGADALSGFTSVFLSWKGKAGSLHG